MADALQTELVHVLEATLSPDTSTRRAAEDRLSTLHAHDPNVGTALSVLVLPGPPSPIAPDQTALRQAAALSLRQLVKTKWSPLFEHFTGYPSGPDGATEAIPEELKGSIRTNLLHALAASPSKSARLAASYTLAAIASSDFPDQFPELLPALGQMLQDEASADSVHGALAFLTEFVRDELDEQQIVGIGQDLLPLMERILAADTKYSPFLRARTLLIFRQLLTTLHMLKDTYPDIVKNAIDGLLPRWLAALTGLISSDITPDLDPSSAWENLALRNEAYKTLKHAAYFRSHFRSSLPSIVEATLTALNHTLASFEAVEMSPSPELEGNLPSAPDGEQDLFVSIAGVAASGLELLGECLRLGDANSGKKKARKAEPSDAVAAAPKNPFFQSGDASQPSPYFKALLSQLFAFARVTQADEETWADDINAFVAADEDEAYVGADSTASGLLRIVAIEQLYEILAAHAALTLTALGGSAGQGDGVLVEACARGHARKAQGVPSWWKDEEAVLACLGSVAELVEESLEDVQGKPLDLEAIFQQVVLPNIGADSPAFLRGRAFVFSSQYASVLPPNLAAQFLEEAVRTIETDHGAGGQAPEGAEIVTISAVRCIKNFHRHLESEVVRPFAGRIISRLGPLLSAAQEDILVLLLETVQAVVAESREGGASREAVVSVETYSAIVQVALNVWAGNARDPVLSSVVSDLFETLAGAEADGVAQAVVAQTLPHLATSMTATPETDEESAPLRQSAVELTGSVLEGASAEVLAAVGAAGIALPHLLTVLNRTEDRDILQYGVRSLTSLIRKVPDQVLSWHDSASDQPAINSILSVVARILSPAEAESGGLAVGDLLIALLRKAGNAVLPALPELLQALVRRVVDAQTASFSQSLILPFAFLMQDQAPVVIDLLESTSVEVTVATASGAERRQVSGLEALTTKWVEDCETFQGFWAQRISTLALTRLLESRRPVLDSVLVKGDQLPDTSNVIRTRSRAKTMPHKFTQISISAKILKILIAEFGRATRGPPGGIGAGLGLDEGERAKTPDTDDEDGEWDDEDEPEPAGKGMSFLSDILGAGGIEGLDADDLLQGVEDEDLKADTVYTMDMKSHLAGFLRGLRSVSPALPDTVSAALTAEEAKKLQSALAFGA